MNAKPIRQWLREISSEVPDSDAAISWLREQGYRVIAGHLDASGQTYALIDNKVNFDLEQYAPSFERWETSNFILVNSADVTQLVRNIKFEEKKREFLVFNTKTVASTKQKKHNELNPDNLTENYLVHSLGVALDAASIAIDGLTRQLEAIATEAEVDVTKFGVGASQRALDHIAKQARQACYTYHFQRGTAGSNG